MHNDKQQEPAAKPRYLLLDFARFVAAISVVLYHYTSRDTGQWPASTRQMFPDLSIVSSYGYLGVQLFFIVSGFVIFMSTENRPVPNFIAARVARIFPAYWLAVLATAGLQALAPELGKEPTVPQVLVNLTMFQVPADVNHVDAVYWTLWVELVFYVLIAVLMAIKTTDRGYALFLFVWPALMFLVTLTEDMRLIDITGAKYSSFFAVGMCLYLIHKHGSKVHLWLLFLLNAAIGMRNTLLFTVPSEPQPGGRFVEEPAVAVVLVVIFIVMVAFTLSPLKHKGWKWMTRAGALTYPLYLTHQYWGLWLIRHLEPALGAWVTLAVSVVASVVLAYVIERWVERPIRPRMRHFVQRVLTLHRET